MPNSFSDVGDPEHPILVFVHGGFCDRHDWDEVIVKLGPRYQAVSFDLPGHGASEPTGDASIGAFAETLTNMRHRQGDRSVLLIAHSAGCRVALESFYRDSGNVVGVILVDAGEVLGEGDANEAVRAFSATLDAIGFHALMRAGFEQSAATIEPAHKDRILARVAAHDPEFGRDFLLSAVAWDAARAASVLANVQVPLQIVQAIGAVDPEHAVPSSWSQLVLTNAPQARLSYVPTGHFVMLERADELSELIERFAADQEKR